MDEPIKDTESEKSEPGKYRNLKRSKFKIVRISILLGIFFGIAYTYRDHYANLYMQLKMLIQNEHTQYQKFTDGLGLPSLLKVPPDQMKKHVKRNLRIRPDKRFINSLAMIDKIRGKTEKKYKTSVSKNSWKIYYGKNLIGKVSRYPSFSELYDIVNNYAEMATRGTKFASQTIQKKELKILEQKINSFSYSKIIKALKQISKKWKDRRDPELLRISAIGYTNLLLIDLNRGGKFADYTASKAIALLALYAAVTLKAVLEEQVILAYALDYNGNAMDMSASLPKKNITRIFIEQGFEALADLKVSATDKNRKIALSILAIDDRSLDIVSWRDALNVVSTDDNFSYRYLVMRSGIIQKLFSIRSHVPLYIQQTLLNDLMEPNDNKNHIKQASEKILKILVDMDIPPDYDPSEWINSKLKEVIFPAPYDIEHFEEQVSANTEQFDGTIFTNKDYRTFISNIFYSTLYEQFSFLFFSLYSIPSTKEFLDTLDEPSMPMVSEMQKFFKVLVDAKEKKSAYREAIHLIKGFRYIDLPHLNWLAKKIWDNTSWGDSRRISLAYALFKKADTRPNHLSYLRKVVDKGLKNVILYNLLTKKYYDNGVASKDAKLASQALLAGDLQKFWKHSYSKNSSPQQQIKNIRYAYELEAIPTKKAHHEMKALAEKHFNDWGVVSIYSEFLSNEKRYKEDIKLLNKWISEHSDDYGFDYIFAHNELAKSYYALGNYEKAFVTASSQVQSWQGGVLIQYARASNLLGNKEEAIEVIKAANKRYPNTVHITIAHVEILLHQKNYEKAAEVIQSKNANLPNNWMKKLAKRIHQQFATDPKIIEKLIAALQNRGFSFRNLHWFLMAYLKHEKGQLSLKIYKTLKHGGDILVYRLGLYKISKKINGGAPPKYDYFEGLTTERDYYGAAIYLHTNVESSVISTMKIPKHFSPTIQDSLWTLKAIALTLLGDQENPLWEPVRKHFSGQSNTHDFVYGQFISGHSDVKNLMKKARDWRSRCEVAFYMALKKIQEKKIAEAADWLIVATSIGVWQTPEFQWAYNLLYKLDSNYAWGKGLTFAN